MFGFGELGGGAALTPKRVLYLTVLCRGLCGRCKVASCLSRRIILRKISVKYVSNELDPIGE